MNTNTGQFIPYDQVLNLPPDEQKVYRPMEIPPTPAQIKRGRVGRNDPCPCASGKKFKRCCLTDRR